MSFGQHRHDAIVYGEQVIAPEQLVDKDDPLVYARERWEAIDHSAQALANLTKAQADDDQVYLSNWHHYYSSSSQAEYDRQTRERERQFWRHYQILERQRAPRQLVELLLENRQHMHSQVRELVRGSI